MSNNKETTTQVIKKVDIQGKPTIIVKEELKKQIDYFHKRVGKDEWSGILFYKVKEGTITDPDKLVIEAVGMYLMDIGDATYTEYSMGASMIDAYDAIPESEDMFYGHIHTHHNMNAYFSGTDEKELSENAKNFNYYLSLIVNFDETYCAKIAIETTVKSTSSITIIDEEYNKTDLETVSEERILGSLKCAIEIESEDIIPPFDSVARYLKVVEEKKEAARAKTLAAMPTYHNYGGGSHYPYNAGIGYKNNIHATPKNNDKKDGKGYVRKLNQNKKNIYGAHRGSEDGIPSFKVDPRYAEFEDEFGSGIHDVAFYENMVDDTLIEAKKAQIPDMDDDMDTEGLDVLVKLDIEYYEIEDLASAIVGGASYTDQTLSDILDTEFNIYVKLKNNYKLKVVVENVLKEFKKEKNIEVENDVIINAIHFALTCNKDMGTPTNLTYNKFVEILISKINVD